MNWIYSVSVSVPTAIREEWIDWMLDEHIPRVMATGCFTSFDLRELLEPRPYPDRFTFNAQYACLTREDYERYLETDAPALRQEVIDQFGDQLISVRTLLQKLTSPTLS